MTNMIEIVMMASAAVMVIICRPEVDQIPNPNIFKAGMMGIVTIFCLSWMADSFLAHNLPVIKRLTSSFAESGSIYFAEAMFVVTLCGTGLSNILF